MRLHKLRSINLLIKPASCNCNLRCSYCFYFDVAENRETYTYGNMSYETLENLVKNVFDCVEYQVNFLFQGGEPTMRGINYFYKLHELIDKYNVNNINTTFSLQTNATLLNKRWFDLFEKYNYLIGISLDGTKNIHDIFRIDIRHKGTFDSVLNNINKLRDRNIDFNILCVINSEVSKNAKEIYNFFKEQDFKFLQFIPALDPLKNYDERDYSLTAENYGKFLDEIFTLWHEDLENGHFVSIRYFENLLLILSGRNPEACDMVGHCSVNTVIEADGSVYPCDFYVIDERRLANINTQSIPEIIFSEKATQFVKESFKIDENCKTCKYLKICRSGCKRHKDEDNVNKFCYSYKYFFGKNLDKLVDIRNKFIK